MAMGDGISPTKSSTASCEAIFRRNLLRGILCIEMAPRTPVWMFLWCFDYPGDCSSLMVFQIFQCSHTLSFTSGGDFLVGGSGSIESGEGRPRLVFPTAASGLFFLSPASVFNTYIWV
nr:hypothetical protein Itr_chr11CG11490 [Ipomoea trifida]